MTTRLQIVDSLKTYAKDVLADGWHRIEIKRTSLSGLNYDSLPEDRGQSAEG
jgi:hypothetical protein